MGAAKLVGLTVAAVAVVGGGIIGARYMMRRRQDAADEARGVSTGPAPSSAESAPSSTAGLDSGSTAALAASPPTVVGPAPRRVVNREAGFRGGLPPPVTRKGSAQPSRRRRKSSGRSDLSGIRASGGVYADPTAASYSWNT